MSVPVPFLVRTATNQLLGLLVEDREHGEGTPDGAGLYLFNGEYKSGQPTGMFTFPPSIPAKFVEGVKACVEIPEDLLRLGRCQGDLPEPYVMMKELQLNLCVGDGDLWKLVVQRGECIPFACTCTDLSVPAYEDSVQLDDLQAGAFIQHALMNGYTFHTCRCDPFNVNLFGGVWR